MGLLKRTEKIINNGLDKIEDCFDMHGYAPDEREEIAISVLKEADKTGKKKIKIRL